MAITGHAIPERQPIMAPTVSPRPSAAQRSIAARQARTRKVMRSLAITAGAPVALVALDASYFHIVPLAVLNHQSQTTAHLLPVAIDGLMLVAAVAMIADRAAWLPRFSFAIGALLTLGANIASVHPVATPVIAYTLAGTPAVALLLSADMLLRLCLPAAPRRRTVPRKAAQSVKAPRTRRAGTRAPISTRTPATAQ